MRTLALLFLSALTALALPSQRDQLNNQYIKARGDYATALKSGNKEGILQAAAAVRDVGKAVMRANEPLIQASKLGNYAYPADVKTNAGRKSYAQKMADLNKSLTAANAAIAAIPEPADASAAGLRAVDLLLGEIGRGIEAHHAASQNIR